MFSLLCFPNSSTQTIFGLVTRLWSGVAGIRICRKEGQGGSCDADLHAALEVFSCDMLLFVKMFCSSLVGFLV
jgi:hypothetical protein